MYLKNKKVHCILKIKNMLDNLLNLVKEHAGEAIINNPAIPNERNDEAVELASNSIVETLKNAASNGNFSDIMSMFQGGNNAGSSPMASAMQSGLVQNLMSKFGLDSNAAGGIASSLLPMVINKFVSKTNDPNDSSFDLQGIISKVAGGAGGLDIQSLIGQFTGGGNAANTNSGGGILDSIKGLFGK